MTSYIYNVTNNELTQSTGPTTTSFGYDRNGNLASKNVTNSQWTYTWDVPGDLLKAANNSGVQGYYGYDGLGRRVESKEGSSTIFYGYLGTETLAEGVTNPYTDYIYANGLRIARVTGAYPGGSPAIFYFHTDALGSTRLVTDANRNVLFSDNYQPFGQDNQSTGSETYKFAGKPYSTSTGLFYDFQRWYDPSIGRFISQDPFAEHLSDPQSLNPYLYVSNTPTSLTDPSGMSNDYGQCGWTSWGACGEDLITGTGDLYVGLSPEDREVVSLTAAVVLTAATGGEAAPLLLAVGAAGFGAGVATYGAYSYATGTNPTLTGALEWGTTGFGAALATYGVYQLSRGLLSSAEDLVAAERVSLNRQFGTAFEKYVAENYGEIRNLGPNQLRLLGDEGTYIPDFQSGAEAKAVRYLSRTSQMRIALQNADATNPLRLYVLESTRRSGPMQQGSC